MAKLKLNPFEQAFADVQATGRCAFFLVGQFGTGVTPCTRQAVPTSRHGWLCRGHQLGDQTYHKDMPSVEVSVDSIIKTEQRKLAGGVRLGSHFHLMRATIYRQDGSTKFPW